MQSEAASPRPAAGAGESSYALRLQRMERLMEIAQTLTSTLDLNKLLARIVEAGRELTDCEGVSIMLVDPRSGELHFRAASSRAASGLDDVAVPREGSIAGWIVTHGQPVRVDDAPHDPRWHAQVDSLLGFQTRSILGVPLVTRAKTIGVLEAVNKRAGSFSENDQSTLQWLAAQASVAIVNAHLFEQSDLVAELVHELRTPLTALLATSQLLLRPELPPEMHTELVSTLQRETTRLSDLTTTFLDMVKLEAGRMPFTVERFDLAALFEECLDILRPQAHQLGVTLASHAPPNLPSLESDRGKLKQVLLNLLSNALKYNRPGGRVDISAAAEGELVRVHVADTGHGIPAEAVPRVFERFYRVPDRDGFVSGTGLGLPIARRIVEALGGTIDLESAVGAGTTVHFYLPLSKHKAGALEGAAPGTAPATST